MKRNAAKRYREPLRNPENFVPPKYFGSKYRIDAYQVNDRRIVSIKPKSSDPDVHIVYLHGGAYINEISHWHWRFIDKIVRRTGAQMSVVEYPLTPEHQYTDTYAMVEKVYAGLAGTHQKIVLMGDSAGGGLAMGLALKINKAKKLRRPDKVVAISPWMDLSISTYIPPGLLKGDVMLNREALRIPAASYAGEMDQQHYLLSPLFGDFEGYPPIGIWVGDSELVVVDMPTIKEKLMAANVPFLYTEGEDMQHVYPLFPTREGREAVGQICNFIKQW